MKDIFETALRSNGVLGFITYDEDLIEGEKLLAKAAVSPADRESIHSLHGIDMSLVARDALINEIIVALTKIFMQQISDAEETSNIDHKFLITGARVAMMLQDDPDFVEDESYDWKTTSVGLYKIGDIGETQIIVNPHISWSQTHSLAFDIENPIRISPSTRRMMAPRSLKSSTG